MTLPENRIASGSRGGNGLGWFRIFYIHNWIRIYILFYVISTGLLLPVMHFVKHMVSIVAFVIGLELLVCYFKYADKLT